MDNCMPTDQMDKFLEKCGLLEFTAAPSPEHCYGRMAPMYLGAYVPREGNQQIITNIRIKKIIPPHPCLKLKPILWCNSRFSRIRMKLGSSLHLYLALFSCLIQLPSLSFSNSSPSVNHWPWIRILSSVYWQPDLRQGVGGRLEGKMTGEETCSFLLPCCFSLDHPSDAPHLGLRIKLCPPPKMLKT